MGFHFIVKLVIIALILLIIYTYIFRQWNLFITKQPSLEDEMEHGFVEGALEGAAETGLIKEREREAIEDLFDGDDSGGKAGADGGENKKKKFVEGEINWKFTDVNSNLDCWKNWDWVSKTDDGQVKILKADIERSVRRKDGRTWCAVDSATTGDMRREFDKPASLMDTVNKYTGNIWGLAGAVGLGLTEELLTRAIQKSSKESIELMAKKVSSESADKIIKKLGKELQEDGVEKLFKESAEKTGKESVEKASRESMEKLGKEMNEKALKEMNKAIGDKFSSKFLKESIEKMDVELKQNVIGRYGKKTFNSIKDDIVRKLRSAVQAKTASMNTKLIGNVVKNRAVSSIRSMGITSSARVLSSSLQKKMIAKLTMEVKQALTISIYKNIMKNVAEDVSFMFARKMAKVILARTLVKTQFIVVTKVLFRTQAKTILAITKSLSKSSDDLAKMALKLTTLSKTLGKQAIKNGFKTGLKSAAKLASKMKPGPLAIFDMLSFALDAADPMNYNAFMSTKDFNKAVEQSNKDRKQLMMDEIVKDETFKASGKGVEDIAYPFVMDPMTDIDGEQMEKEISAKISKLFAMAKIGQVHKSISSYLTRLNKDLAIGVLTVEKLEDSSVMETYIALIDIDSIVSVYNIDACKRVGGVVWDTDKCTFSKDKCNKLYKWPLDTKEDKEREDERYAEFVDGKCVMGNPEIRSMCDTMDAKWDINNYKCKMDKEYCRIKGGELDANGDCSIPLTQQAFEFIFGTTVSRIGATYVRETVDGVKAIFDFFFVGCGHDGEFKVMDKCMDYSNGRIAIWDCNKSSPQKFMYNSIDNSIRPLTDSKKCLSVDSAGNIIVQDYSGESRQKFMYDESKKQLMLMENQSLCINLIGDNNANGTRFQLAQCKDVKSQQFNLSRDIIVDTGAHCSITTSRLADCPPSYTNNGLTCGRGDDTAFTDSGRLADCPSTYTNNGATCGRGDHTAFTDSGRLADCPPSFTNMGANCQSGDNVAFWDSGRVADCPSGYTNMGLTCYRGPDTRDNGGNTLASCPSGYYNNGTSCWRDYKSFTRDSFNCVGKQCMNPCTNQYKSDGDPWPCSKDAIGARAYPSCTAEARYLGKQFWNEYSNGGAFCALNAKSISFKDNAVCASDEFMNTDIGRCYKYCPSGYYNTGVSCQRDASTLTVDSMTCNNDEFLSKKSGRCYKLCSQNHGGDYTHDGTKCYKPAEFKSMDSMTCGDREFKSGARCYKQCKEKYGNDYEHTGVSCYRMASTKGMDSMTCGDGEFKSGARCYKQCKEKYGDDYEHTGVSCYRMASTKGEDSMTCQSHEYKMAGRCYPKLLPGFTDLGLTQSRKKKSKSENVALLKNSVNKIASAVKATYN